MEIEFDQNYSRNRNPYFILKNIWSNIQSGIDRLLLSLLEGILLLLGIVVLVLVLPRCLQDISSSISSLGVWIREHPREVSQWLMMGRLFFFLYGLTSFFCSLDELWNDCMYYLILWMGGCPHCAGIELSGSQSNSQSCSETDTSQSNSKIYFMDPNKNIRIREGDYLQGFQTFQ
jgi:hypothetical protein